MKDIFLIVALVVSMMLCAVLFAFHIINKKKVRTLTQSIDKFIKDGTMTELATKYNVGLNTEILLTCKVMSASLKQDSFRSENTPSLKPRITPSSYPISRIS